MACNWVKEVKDGVALILGCWRCVRIAILQRYYNTIFRPWNPWKCDSQSHDPFGQRNLATFLLCSSLLINVSLRHNNENMYVDKTTKVPMYMNIV